MNISIPWYVAVPTGIALLMLVFSGVIVPRMRDSSVFALIMVALSWIMMLVIVFGDKI